MQSWALTCYRTDLRPHPVGALVTGDRPHIQTAQCKTPCPHICLTVDMTGKATFQCLDSGDSKSHSQEETEPALESREGIGAILTQRGIAHRTSL